MKKMETKVCKNCKEEKEFNYFHNLKNGKYGKHNICKTCRSIYEKGGQYLYKKEEVKILEKKVCNMCKIEKDIKEFKSRLNKNGTIYNTLNCYKCLYKINKETTNKWKKNNPIRIKEKRKQYAEKYENQNKKDRRKNDVLYKLKCNIGCLIRNGIKKNGFKKGTKTEKILGIGVEEFKIYLESKFEPWMSWDNYGKYNGELNYGWDIDHITPLSEAKTEEYLIMLNYYTNLQPLCSYTNRNIKKDKINYQILDEE